MAVALPFIMIGMSVLGSVMGAQQAQKQGDAAAAAAKFNADAARRNAGIARQQASDDAAAQRRDSTQKLGAMRAAYGASGVTLDGSPTDVLEASARNAELDNQMIKYKGELRAMGYEDSATLDDFSGATAQEAGNDKASGILLSGAVKAGGSAYNMGMF